MPLDTTMIEIMSQIYPGMAAAGLWSTPSDLTTLGIEVQMALKLLLPETVPSNAYTAKQRTHRHCFFLNGKGNAVRFLHNGADEGFIALASFYKNSGQSAVIMINSNEKETV